MDEPIDLTKVLPREFYSRDATTVAKKLLGKYILRRVDGQNLVGKIVETESYLPFIDPAAHSFIGPTLRNAVLFGEAGYAYVFSIHRYFCLNFVCDSLNVPGCVLIRALEPIEGIEIMREYRLNNNKNNLTNGPGRLCQALQIDKNLNGIDITISNSELRVIDAVEVSSDLIETTPRIGITKAAELPLRFYIKDNKFVS